jgi:hypothetical protein
MVRDIARDIPNHVSSMLKSKGNQFLSALYFLFEKQDGSLTLFSARFSVTRCVLMV